MNNQASNESYRPGGPQAGRIMIVLFLIYIFDYADRMVVSSMLEFIKRDWAISDTQAGLLMSVISFFITVFSFPASILIDRWSRRKMVALMTFFWSVATLMCAFTKNYTQLLVARAFIGIGEAGYAPGGTAMLSAAYPEEKRARTMGIWNASIPLGAGIGLVAGGLIAREWGWHHAFGVVALPGMILAYAAWKLPDYKSVKPDESAGGKRGFFSQTVAIFRIRSLVFTYLAFAMNVSATTALMWWLPSYFERTGFAAPGRGGVFTSVIFALVLIGAPLGGYLSDYWQKRHKRARMTFPAITSALAAFFLFFSLLSREKPAMMVLLVFFGIAVTCFVAPAVAVTQDVVHPGMRAFSYGLNVIVQHILGDIWSPLIIGKLSDVIGIEKALLLTPIYGLLAALFFFIGSGFYPGDLERAEKVELKAEQVQLH